MIAIVIFLVGSALSGLSHTIDQLIAFRALQGLGAGGLMVGAIATMGDLVSPRERGQYMGYMMAAMMLAMIAGPLVGGYITDSLSWRWIFYINMPIGGAALLYLWATLHLPRQRVKRKIDYLGAALLAVAATAIVLLTTWGGSQYAWGSPEILGLAGSAVASAPAFCLAESRAAEPVLPLHVFRNRNFSLASAMSFLLGLMAMFGALTFLPLYQQTVQHAVGDRQRADADPADVRLDGHLADLRAGNHQDRPVQDPPDHRRAGHDRRACCLLTHAGRRHHLAHLRRSTSWCSASAWAS